MDELNKDFSPCASMDDPTFNTSAAPASPTFSEASSVAVVEPIHKADLAIIINDLKQQFAQMTAQTAEKDKTAAEQLKASNEKELNYQQIIKGLNDNIASLNNQINQLNKQVSLLVAA